MKYTKSKEILINFWMKEKHGWGLKRFQFNCGVSKYSRDRFLRELRKQEKIRLSKKRYYLNQQFYKSLK